MTDRQRVDSERRKRQRESILRLCDRLERLNPAVAGEAEQIGRMLRAVSVLVSAYVGKQLTRSAAPYPSFLREEL